MPGPPNEVPKEYLVVAGKRRELHEIDIDWVRANCPVKGPEKVH
jgi:hypothetical protein